MMLLLYIIGYISAWPAQLIFFKKKIYYEDKKHTSRFVKGPAIIISNHRSLKDFMMSIFIFPFHKLYCLMSELIYSHGKFISFITTIMGGIKVDRKSYDFTFINKSLNLLKRKKLLIIYPEAKIATTKRMLPFHPSYILIALKSGAPIIPIYTDGVYKLFKRTRVVIGKKIYLRDYCKSDNPTKEEIDSLNKMVKNKIEELGKICQKKTNHDKYPQGIKIRLFFKDLGRLLAFSMNLWFRVKIHYKNKNNKKIKGGGVIVSNHQGFTDPLLLLNVFFRRRIYILTAEIVFDGHPIRSWLLKQLGCVRVDRNINDIDSFNQCKDIINAGNLVLVFPGGHIDKQNQDSYKLGSALLALKTNTPIYPVYIKPNKKKMERFHVYIGDKIDVDKMFLNTFEKNKLDLVSNEVYDSIINLKEDANKNLY